MLLHLKKKLQLAAFFRVINSRPIATALIEASAQADDPELLKDLYYQDDRRLDGANVFVREALQEPDSRAAIDKLGLASKLLSDSKETSIEVRALHEANVLLRMQNVFQEQLTEDFIGLSVNETIFKLIRLGYTSRVKKMQSEFKVPDKTFWWIRYIYTIPWEALHSLSPF